MDTSDEKITEYFGRYHAAYRDSARHAQGQDLSHLIEALDLAPQSQVLDAACGTGHTSLALAQQGHRVTGMDLTPEMLNEAKLLAGQKKLSVTWETGDVHQLPWPDQTFDAVTCRRAAHHFRDLPKFLAQVYRVLKPAGLLGISDMTAPSVAIDDLNQLERLRDSSHQRARSANQWAALVDQAGLDLRYLQVSVEPMLPTEWLSPVAAESSEGIQAMAYLHSTNVAPGLLVNGNFHKYRIILVALKP